jgi:hypothetical protein
VGTDPSRSNQELATELKWTITGRKTRSGPDASPKEMLKALIPVGLLILAVL